MKPIERTIAGVIVVVIVIAVLMIITSWLAYVPYESPCSKHCELCIDEAEEFPCE